MNIVLYLVGVVASSLLTWCFFLPPVTFVLVVGCVCIIALASSFGFQLSNSW